MPSLMQSVVIIALLLVIVNGAMDGAVQAGIHELLTSDEKKEMRTSLLCTAGLLMYPPYKEMSGVQIPLPSFDDIIISIAITGTILFVLHLVKASPTWKGALLLFGGVWLAFKLTGLALIKYSGTNCESVMMDMAGLLDGVYSVTAILGLGVVYKVVKSWRGLK